MTGYRSWGTPAWIAFFNLPVGIWAVTKGSYVVGGILLGLTAHGLVRVAVGLVAHQRLVKRPN
jgi:hypothetical protein